METQNPDIRKAKLSKRFLAYKRHVGPYAGDQELFARLFREVADWAGPKGLLESPGAEAITVYHDDPEAVPTEEQRISVGFTVPEGTATERDLKILELPEGEYVVGSFRILPDEYPQAWARVMEYMQEQGLSRDQGIWYESYRNDPHKDAEGKHEVDICVKV